MDSSWITCSANGDLSTYTPDFIVRTTDGAVWIVETKGREELDVPQKMARLRQWCADATEASQAEDGPRYGFVYVDQEGFEQHKPAVVRRTGDARFANTRRLERGTHESTPTN